MTDDLTGARYLVASITDTGLSGGSLDGALKEEKGAS
jgi:hypothetical protein